MDKYIIITAILILVSCKENPIDSKLQPPYSNSSFIPVAIGNYWQYTDSLYDGAIQNSSVEINAFSIDSTGVVWWKLSNITMASSFIPNEFKVINDSIFEITINPWSGNSTVSLAIPPPQPESFTYTKISSDFGNSYRVTLYNTPYKTPAGTFTQWASYIHDNAIDRRDSIVIAPGIGILSRTRIWRNFSNDSTHISKSVLINYLIK